MSHLTHPSHLLPLLPTLLLFALLGAAVWHDVRARRIPNAIVFPGALAALALHTLLPSGTGLGLFGTPMGGLGLATSLGGLALGLAVLLPMYALRLMGAGDAKLLAMVGAFAGAGQVLAIALLTLVVGGVLAIAVAAWQRSLRRVLGNTWHMALGGSLAALGGSMPATPGGTGRLPYAVAIAGATVPCVMWLHVHGSLPL